MNWLCSMPLDKEDLPFQARLHEDLVAELYRQSRVALGMLCVLFVFIRIIVAEAIRRAPALEWVSVAMVLTILGRAAWLLVLARDPERFPSTARRHGAFILGSTLTSACFAVLNLGAFPRLSPFPLALLCVCQAGICTTAMVSMSGSPLAYLLYMVPIVGSAAAMSIAVPPPVLPVVFPLTLFAFMIAQLGVSWEFHRTLRDNFLGKLKLNQLARRDVLTGLRNRRYLQEFLEDESPRIQRSWRPESRLQGHPTRNLAFVMVDFDHFKSINDTYGHAAGDEILKQVAEVLSRIIRKPDLVARWGGEEFVILFLDVDRRWPMASTERIREAIEAHPFRLPSGETLQRTCSLGYACYPFLREQPDLLAWEEVLSLADAALYHAKLAGRNRAVGLVPGNVPHARIAEALRGGEEGLPQALAAGILTLVGKEGPLAPLP